MTAGEEPVLSILGVWSPEDIFGVLRHLQGVYGRRSRTEGRMPEGWLHRRNSVACLFSMATIESLFEVDIYR